MLSTSEMFFRILLPLILIFPSAAIAGETAVLSPDGTETSRKFAAAIELDLKKSLPLTDSELAAAVLKARDPKTPYNLTIRDARLLGSAIGCSHYVLVRGDVIRRSTFERKEYFEAYGAVFVVKSKTGELILWKLYSAEKDDAETAIGALSDLAPAAAETIATVIDSESKTAAADRRPDKAQAAEGEADIRFPLPYRRIKPGYTWIADYYGVEATVDIEVGIDAEGSVSGTRIVRWAGFGLDESVDKTVREMNCRAADRRGETLAMTVLLRYNFKDLDNDDLPK